MFPIFLTIRISKRAAHQHNVNRSKSHTKSSQIFQGTSPVLGSTSRCSQTPLKLSRMLSDSARAFSSAPGRTCSDGGAFRMLWNMTNISVKHWSFGVLYTNLPETTKEAKTAAQLCRRRLVWPWLVCPSAGDWVPYIDRSCSDITTSHFVLFYLSLL
jgi:hypothetical protein